MLIDLQQPISDMEIFRCVHFSPTQLCVGERFGTSDCTGCKSYTVRPLAKSNLELLSFIFVLSVHSSQYVQKQEYKI